MHLPAWSLPRDGNDNVPYGVRLGSVQGTHFRPASAYELEFPFSKNPPGVSEPEG